MDNQELLISIILAYKDYIDCCCGLPEEERSNLLMIARELEIEAGTRELYDNKLL